MMPNREAVLYRAKQLFAEDCFRNGISNSNTPEDNELLESGFYQQALTELMSNPETRFSEWANPEKETEQKPQVSNFKNKSLNDILQDDEFLNSLLRAGLCVFGSSGCGKTTLVKTLVKMLTQKGINFYILDPSQAWLDMRYEVIEVSKEQKTYNWKLATSVFDTSRLAVKDKITFADAFCRTLLESHMNGLSENEILVLEESELYLQNSILRSKKCENIQSLIAMGRNFHLRYIALSQAPALLDKLFLKLCELKLYGFLSEVNDLNYLRKMLGKAWVEQTTKLDTGEFVFQSKRSIEKVKVETSTTKGFNYSFEQHIPTLATSLKSQDSL